MAFVKVFPYLRKSTAVRNDFGWEQQKSQRRGVDKEKTSFLKNVEAGDHSVLDKVMRARDPPLLLGHPRRWPLCVSPAVAQHEACCPHTSVPGGRSKGQGSIYSGKRSWCITDQDRTTSCISARGSVVTNQWAGAC